MPARVVGVRRQEKLTGTYRSKARLQRSRGGSLRKQKAAPEGGFAIQVLTPISLHRFLLATLVGVQRGRGVLHFAVRLEGDVGGDALVIGLGQERRVDLRVPGVGALH